MSGITMREAARADRPAILDLYASPAFNGRTLSAAEAEPIFDRMETYPHFRPYLAVDAEGAAVGTFTLMILDNVAHMGTPIGLVENVVVSPQAQGLGVGRQMMQAAGEIATAAGAYKLILATGLGRTGAHQFYESLGFARYGYSYGLPLKDIDHG